MSSMLFRPGARWSFANALAWIATRDEDVVSRCHNDIAWGEPPTPSTANERVRKAVDNAMLAARANSRKRSVSKILQLTDERSASFRSVPNGLAVFQRGECAGKAFDELCSALASSRISATASPGGGVFPPAQVPAIWLNLSDPELAFPTGIDDLHFSRAAILELWPADFSEALKLRPSGRDICNQILVLWGEGTHDGKAAFRKMRKTFDRKLVKRDDFDRFWRFMTGGRTQGVKAVPLDSPVSIGHVPDEIPE